MEAHGGREEGGRGPSPSFLKICPQERRAPLPIQSSSSGGCGQRCEHISWTFIDGKLNIHRLCFSTMKILLRLNVILHLKLWFRYTERCIILGMLWLGVCSDSRGEQPNTRGSATKTREISSTSLSMNLHFWVYTVSFGLRGGCHKFRKFWRSHTLMVPFVFEMEIGPHFSRAQSDWQFFFKCSSSYSSSFSTRPSTPLLRYFTKCLKLLLHRPQCRLGFAVRSVDWSIGIERPISSTLEISIWACALQSINQD